MAGNNKTLSSCGISFDLDSATTQNRKDVHEVSPLKEVDSGRGSSLRKNFSGSTRTLSSSSSSTSISSGKEPGSDPAPPDGGWGWVVVFASFMINLIADGVSLSFGMLFIDLVGYFDESKAKTAWVGSLFLSMPLLTGPIASSLTDRYGCRKVSIVGSLLAAGGFIISYFSYSLELLFLTFSIAGFGLALCYVASIVIVAYYFEKRRSLATGLAVCGTGIGTFVFSPLTLVLLEHYAWRGTLLILSGFFLNIMVVAGLMRDLDDLYKSSDSDLDEESESKRYSAMGQLSCDDNLDKLTGRLCASVVQLPTYIENESTPIEVINELSHKEGGYLNSLLGQYPNFMNSVLPPFGDSNALPPVRTVNTMVSLPCGDTLPPVRTVETMVSLPCGDATGSPIVEKQVDGIDANQSKDARGTSTKSQKYSIPNSSLWQKGLSNRSGSSYLRNMRLQRGSLTYRGAMLNIPRYRLRASSCPDIYRNSMMTISDEKRCVIMKDLRDLLVDIVDLTIFKNLRYTLFCVSNFLLYACVDILYVYLPDNAISLGIEKETASFLISILGILNTIGVVMVGYIGDQPWIDPALLYTCFISISGIATSFIPWVKGYAGMAIIAAVYGLTISANYTLVSVIVVNLISLDSFTNAYGLLLLIQGLASVVGPPIAGWLYDLTGTYDTTFYVTGMSILLSGVMVAPVAKKWTCPCAPSSCNRRRLPEEQTQRAERVRFKDDGDDETVNSGSKLLAPPAPLLKSSSFLRSNSTESKPESRLVIEVDAVGEPCRQDETSGDRLRASGDGGSPGDGAGREGTSEETCIEEDANMNFVNNVRMLNTV